VLGFGVLVADGRSINYANKIFVIIDGKEKIGRTLSFETGGGMSASPSAAAALFPLLPT
jgi:hypothetical protein